MKKIFLITLLSIIILSGCTKETNKEENKIVEKNGMLSYTIDGEKTDVKPTKEEGYIVNKIICDNGSDMMWDNDNWEVEFTNLVSKDRCKIDFTKDTSKEGYRVTVTSNLTSALYSLSKATTLNGTVKIYSKSTIKSVTGCNGVIEDNKVIVSNITSNQICNIEIELKTLADSIKAAYPSYASNTRTDFSVIDNGTPNLYNGGNDGIGTTYYFSGDGSTMKNWVKFADKWWRIIRINGNGSVRLLYAGDGTSANDIGSSSFNSTKTHPQYVGWKYTAGDSLSTNRENGTPSTIYSKVETWYNGIGTTNQNYVDTNAIYCNDREIGSGSYSTSKNFEYAAYTRHYRNKSPIFTCSNTSDMFYTFGLMTADEVAYAGGKYGARSPKAYYYLAKDGTSSITGDQHWWTMSPYRFSVGTSSSAAWVFYVRGSGDSGYLSDYLASNSYVVRPVISLKSNTLVSGTGSSTDPYVVQGLQ